MSLFEPGKEILSYLVAFREAAPTSAAPPLNEVRQELDRLFEKLAQGSQGLFTPVGSYEMAAHALSAMTDQVIIESGWKHSPKWAERPFSKKIMGKERAGIDLLTFIRDMRNAPPEVTALFYLCLALGYHGDLTPEDHGLTQLKKELLKRLPNNGESDSSAPRIGSSQPKDALNFATLWAGVATGLAALVGGILLFTYQPEPAPQSGGRPVTPFASLSGEGRKNPAQPQGAAKPSQPEKQFSNYQASLNVASNNPLQKAADSSTQKNLAAKAPVKPAAPRIKKDLSLTKSLEEASPYDPPSIKSPTDKTGHDLQAGVFVGPIQAARLASSFLKAGFPARVEYQKRSQGGGWYVVYLGPLNQEKAIRKARRYMKKTHKIKPILKEHKPSLPSRHAGIF